MHTKIIYEDSHLIVVCKPAGFATQTAKVGEADTVSELKKYLAQAKKGQPPYLGVIHRLDQPVEGLLVFAKEKRAAAALTKQLETGALKKKYSAVICGKPTRNEGELVDLLYKNKDGKAQVVTKESLGEPCGGRDSSYDAKKAILYYRIGKEISSEREIFLADIRIETGRFHQIRAQMAHAGMPLLGDRKYGNETSIAVSLELGVSGPALCACGLSFIHPVTGGKMSFQEEPEGKAFHWENL